MGGTRRHRRLFAAALIVPLGALASVFAPLIAFDGVVRAAVAPIGRPVRPSRLVADLLQLGFVLLAVGATDPMLSWLAVTAAATAALLPTAAHHTGPACWPLSAPALPCSAR